ncbi:hypothetical protein OIU35_00215 [Boseaceae bacterium BT-24-1]|nr:hypothetical protein [Boseaceae bacterium BT-24-1]
MATIELKNILDDVRARDAALLNMIVAIDNHSLALFRIYVTLAVALASAAVVGSASTTGRVDAWTVWGAGSAALGLALACHFCILSIRSVKLGVPGKNADFWQWAIREDVTYEAMLEAYLQYSDQTQQQNYRVNDHSTKCLKIAKRLGVASVIVGGTIALAGATGLATFVRMALARL